LKVTIAEGIWNLCIDSIPKSIPHPVQN
jgi:hypothetical protein